MNKFIRTVFSFLMAVLAYTGFCEGQAFTVGYAIDPSGYAAGAAIELPLVFTSETEIQSVQARNLPMGLRIDPTSKAMIGTPTKPGVYEVALTARNVGRESANSSFTMKIRNFVDPEVFPLVQDQYGPYVPGVVADDDMSSVLTPDTLVSGLPAGMRWDKAKMKITGAATRPGNSTVTFTRTISGVRHVASATYVVGAFPVLKVVKIGNGNGTVLGATDKTPANRKVQIRGTASPDSVFAGWYLDEAATMPLQGDTDYRTPNLQYTMTAAAETTVYGRFIPKSEDVNVSFVCPWPEEGIPAGQNPALRLEVQSETAPKVTVRGVPAGIRFDAKSLTFVGAATKPGVYEMTVTVANASGKTVTQTVVAKIQNYRSDAIPVKDEYPLEMVGVAVELSDPAFEGCRVTGLPTGLKLVGTLITGAPTRAGNFTAVFTKGKEKASSTFRVTALPSAVVATYSGSVLGDQVEGAASMTVAATGRISGKIQSNGANWTFSATSFSSSSMFTSEGTNLMVQVTAKVGREEMPVFLVWNGSSVLGTFGPEGSAADVKMWRNAGNDKAMQARAAQYVGVYTVSLECEETGYGYLSMTVDNRAGVKVTGKMPDGTSLTATTPLLFDGDVAQAVLYTAPAAYKGGYVFDTVRFVKVTDTNSGEVVSIVVEDSGMTWKSYAQNASSTYEEGFDRSVTLRGAWYNKLGALSDYYTQMALVADLPSYWAKITDVEEEGRTTYYEEETAVEPDCWSSLTISVKGNAFVVDQGKMTQPQKVDGEWVYEGANDAGLTFTFTQATGIFRGSFTAWYDYTSEMDWVKFKEKLAHQQRKVSFEGVAVQGESILMRGFFLNDAIGEYEDASGNVKTFTYKESLPISFE